MQDDTQGSRCLTILARSTRVTLLAELWPVLFAIARLVFRFRRGQVSPAATFEFESERQRLLREMGRLIVQGTFNHLEPDDCSLMPGQFFWDGEYDRRRHQSPLRNLACWFGPIRLLRFCYQPLEHAGRCLFPLELQRGIVAGVATPALADTVARRSADLPQRQVLGQLRPHGIEWGVRTLRKLQHAVAESGGEFRHAAPVERVLEWLAKAAAQAGPRRITLSVGRDGIMLPIVQSEKYKEAATATVSVLDRRGRRLGTVYRGQMPQPGQGTLSQQLPSLLEDVLRQWTGPMPRWTYVTDAGHHPTECFEQTLSRMLDPRTGKRRAWQWIVDY